jgi:hypothetical protein
VKLKTPRTQIQAGAVLIGALLLHELQNGLENKEKKKGKEDGLRNGFVEEICLVHQTPC